MKFTKFLIASALSFLALNATAQNLYRPGTQGYELAAYAEKVLPSTVSPYFVMMSDPAFFEDQFSKNANEVIRPSSLQNLKNRKWTTHPRAGAFTVYGNEIPETAARKVCVVIFVDPKLAKVGSTLMHELMHCRIESAELSDSYRKQIVRAAHVVPGINGGTQFGMFEEVLARAMSLTFLVNDGLKEDGDFFENRLTKPYPLNPGPLSVPRAMEICIEKDSCSTDPGVLAKTLLDDPQFVEALRTDIIDGYKIDLKTGFSKD